MTDNKPEPTSSPTSENSTDTAELSSPLDEMSKGHFIPFRKSDVIDMLSRDGVLNEADQKSFREAANILQALLHFEYHERLEALKDSYAPFNPDSDSHLPPTEDKLQTEAKFLELLRDVLSRANYVELSAEEIAASLDSDPNLKMRLEVDQDDLENMIVFRRGKHTTREVIKSKFSKKEKVTETQVFDRLVVYMRFKDAEYFKEQGRKHIPFTPGDSYLKLFRNVPSNALEMLFPNAKMKMRLLDKLLLAIPAALGSIGVLAKLIGPLILVFSVIAVWVGLKEGSDTDIDSKQLVALGVGLVTLMMYSFRQYNKIKNRRLRYMKYLSENLYFRVLDNNAGVFHCLIDAAEEEDSKEAMIAYYFILTSKEKFTEPTLDAHIENWFKEKHSVELDFEVDDAMHKLERLGLSSYKDGKLEVVSLDEAKRIVDKRWDELFTYSNGDNT